MLPGKDSKNPADVNPCPHSEEQVQEHQGQEADPVPSKKK